MIIDNVLTAVVHRSDRAITALAFAAGEGARADATVLTAHLDDATRSIKQAIKQLTPVLSSRASTIESSALAVIRGHLKDARTGITALRTHVQSTSLADNGVRDAIAAIKEDAKLAHGRAGELNAWAPWRD